MRDVVIKKKALTPKQVEEAYGLDAGTLANWRIKGKGPEYVKVGGKVLYMVDKLEAWLRQGRVQTA